MSKFEGIDEICSCKELEVELGDLGGYTSGRSTWQGAQFDLGRGLSLHEVTD